MKQNRSRCVTCGARWTDFWRIARIEKSERRCLRGNPLGLFPLIKLLSELSRYSLESVETRLSMNQHFLFVCTHDRSTKLCKSKNLLIFTLKDYEHIILIYLSSRSKNFCLSLSNLCFSFSIFPNSFSNHCSSLS